MFKFPFPSQKRKLIESPNCEPISPQTLIGTYRQSFPLSISTRISPLSWMENSHSTCEESIVFHSFAFHHRYKYEDGGTFGLQSRLGFHSKLDLLGLNLRLDFLYSG
ncbi:hypothetical protein L1987_10739 [Smallanthus sonchifolius]|uniref:Uncharacterized protein n=1 Tax=Smallanthus sonchifolius TaxID=185202 RepID=A0ACB9J8X2_9ASTR|nr:hypothetical protein L1987_10739 [Smallanthus sonchifolius]